MTPAGSDNSSVERDLLAQAVAGDTLALQRLLIGYQGRLLARIQRKLPLALRTTISAEDVLQEAYVDIVRGVRDFRPQGSHAFARWLVMVADSRLIDAIRAQQAVKRGGEWQSLDPHGGGSTVTPMLERVQVDSHSPSRSVAGHDVQSAIQAALAELKDDYREAVRLRFLQGLEISEVAARMHRTEWSVHKLCSRGLKRLRDVLGDGSRFWSQS
ncbi:MAG TPA: sigma-70 family RNA polymerase sigma factor [Phycisphaerae bacterium]